MNIHEDSIESIRFGTEVSKNNVFAEKTGNVVDKQRKPLTPINSNIPKNELEMKGSTEKSSALSKQNMSDEMRKKSRQANRRKIESHSKSSPNLLKLESEGKDKLHRKTSLSSSQHINNVSPVDTRSSHARGDNINLQSISTITKQPPSLSLNKPSYIRKKLNKIPMRKPELEKSLGSITPSPRIRNTNLENISSCTKSSKKQWSGSTSNLTEIMQAKDQICIKSSQQKYKAHDESSGNTLESPVIKLNKNILNSLHTPSRNVSFPTSRGLFTDLTEFCSKSSSPLCSPADNLKSWTISSSYQMKKKSSPIEANETNNNEKSLPTLVLGSFQSSLWLNFGSEQENLVGKPKSLDVVISNPTIPKSFNSYMVQVEKVPFKKGVSLTLNGHDPIVDITNLEDLKRHVPDPFIVKEGESKMMKITWTPTESGRIRESIHLKLNRGRVTIVIYGSARGIGSSSNTKVMQNLT